MSWAHTSGNASNIANIENIDSVDVVDTVTDITNPVDMEIGGVAPQLDDTDKLATSMWGKNGVAGDTALTLTTGGEFPSVETSKFLLQSLLTEVRIMNQHLSIVTGETIVKDDAETIE